MKLYCYELLQNKSVIKNIGESKNLKTKKFQHFWPPLPKTSAVADILLKINHSIFVKLPVEEACSEKKNKNSPTVTN